MSNPNQFEFSDESLYLREPSDWDMASEISIVFESDGLENHGETNWMHDNIALLRLGHICVFNQIREGANPEQAAITESIKKIGLINALDVVRISKDFIESYADFVAELWGGDKADSSYLPESTFAPGMYDLLVAGHSRLIALREIETEKGQIKWAMGSTDYNPRLSRVSVKLHKAESISDIIKIQINENIHKSPPGERTAIILVESYYLGIKAGLWSNPEEFQQQYEDKFSTIRLKEAMAFAKLPSDIRELVFTKLIPYEVGILLGNYSDILHQYSRFKYFNDKPRNILSPEEKEKLDYHVESGLMMEATKIIKNRVKFTPARKHFMALTKAKIELMQGDVDQSTLSNIFDETAKADIDRNTRKIRDEINNLLDEMVNEEEHRIIKAQRLIGESKNREPRLNKFLEGVLNIAEQAKKSIA